MKPKKAGPPSFGYMRKGDMLVAHPEEAPVRLQIFELFAEHKRKKLVAGILNAEGHRTRSGAEFSGTTVGRLIQDPMVKGIAGVAVPLVPTDLWETCNDILSGQKEAGGASRPVVHLFSGYVHCGCGQKMYVPSRTNKYVCQVCRAKIPCDDLEVVFRSQLGHYPSNLKNQWPHLPFESQREIVELLTERIEIRSKKVTCILFEL